MPKREHWFAFLDDVGDPGLRGTAYFGYTVAALRTGSLPNLTEMRARLRVETSSFRESKRGSISSSGFLRNIQGAVALAAAGHLLAASVFIRKDRYSGPWLRPQSDATTRTLPADAGYLRNYLIRKALELVFEGIAGPEATMDVVLDRVDMSDRQILNLARYLRGDFAEYGLFGFPHPTHVTHADSRYVEGLQVVDHLARLAYAVSAGTATEQQTDLLRDFMRMHSVISSRQFAMRDEAEDGLSRFARETQ